MVAPVIRAWSTIGNSMKLGELRRLIREELTSPAPAPQQQAPAAPQGGTGSSLNKLIDDMANQFVAKMKQTYPNAEQAIQQEAQALKTQIVAQVKASAAKVKTSTAS